MRKVQNFSSKIVEQITSEHILTMLHVTKLLCFIMAVNHLIACSWYGVGTISAQKTWVARHFDDTHGAHYRYVTCLYAARVRASRP